ncbi:ATP-binding protein [Fusibacter bizertensis]
MKEPIIKPSTESLYKWILKSFLKTALVPFLAIEIGFIVIYFSTSMWSRQETVYYLHSEVEAEMNQLVLEKSSGLQNQLKSVAITAEFLSLRFKEALANDPVLDIKALNRMATTGDGVYYSLYNEVEGGPAVFYSGVHPIGDVEKTKVLKLLGVGSILKDVIKVQSLASQVYINTYDSLNVIFPYFNVITQYPPKMDIPTYNFYYEADLQHNPDKQVVWTDAYLDPAGQGWMSSAIAPVYNADNFLEGVAGIDVTVNTFTQQILNMDIPYDGYVMLIGKTGNILALPDNGESDWGLKELNTFHYADAILKDTFKPEDFNLYNREEMKALALKISEDSDGYGQISLQNSERFISWSTIESTGWKLLMIVPVEKVFSSLSSMSNQLFNIGLFMISALLVFFVVFFIILSRRAMKVANNISIPLIEINNMVELIRKGEYFQTPPDLPVQELQDTANRLAYMGEALGIANNRLINTQADLKKNESELSAVLNSIDDIIMEIDGDGNLINLWNKNNNELSVEYAQSSLINIASKLSKQNKRFKDLIDEILTSGSNETVEYYISTEIGLKWYLARISAVESEERKLVISARDVTLQKNLEFSLIEAKEIAEHANQSKSQFLSNMSHELRTPLNAILGFSQLLLMESKDKIDEFQLENITEISNAGQHLLKLINEVLDLAKIESGKMAISLEPVSVIDVMKEAITMVHPLAEFQNINLICDFSLQDEVFVTADHTRLKQVLINLLTNAIKYNVVNGEVNLNYKILGDIVAINVIDNGIGIPFDQQDAVFNPFHRLNMNNNFNVEGTGIGLSVAKQMTELMNGKISLVSELNKGSHFSIELPLAAFKIQEENLISTEKSLFTKNSNYRVLYVEDNKANLKLVKRIFENRGNFVLYDTQQGELAVEIALEKMPDIILLDLNLPGIDGFEVLKRLRANKLLQNIPVVAVTAYAMNDDQQRIKKAGFDGYIIKPIDIQRFIDEINRMLMHK